MHVKSVGNYKFLLDVTLGNTLLWWLPSGQNNNYIICSWCHVAWLLFHSFHFHVVFSGEVRYSSKLNVHLPQGTPGEKLSHPASPPSLTQPRRRLPGTVFSLPPRACPAAQLAPRWSHFSALGEAVSGPLLDLPSMWWVS